MAKIKLTASPTFKSPVMIPVPGGRPASVEFTFKGRTKDEFRDFVDGIEGRDDVSLILDIASGWDLDDPFGKETVEQLLQNYMGSARAILDKYMGELMGARLGN